MKKTFIITGISAVVIVCLLVVSYLYYNKKNAEIVSDMATISIGQRTLVAPVERTPADQQKGLGGVTSLSDSQGMLFVFNAPAYYGFWMKDMLIPIDMIWLDQNLKITFIAANVPPSSYPQVIQPTAPSEYVLETSANFSVRQNLKVGDSIKILSETSPKP